MLHVLQGQGTGLPDDGPFAFFGALLARVPPDRRLMVIGGLILAAIALKNLIGYGNLVLHSLLNARVTHHLRIAIVDQLLSLSHAYLDGRPSGELLNTLATETWRTTQALGSCIALLVCGSAVLVFTALLLAISWEMTLAVAAFSVAITLLTRVVTVRVKRLGVDAVAANSNLSTRMWELLGGMSVIRAFGREEHERDRFDRASVKVRDTFFRMERLSAAVAPMHEVLSVLLVLGVILESTMSGRSSLPMLVAFAMVLLRLQPQIRHLGSSWVQLASADSAVRDVMGLLDRADKTYIRSGRIAIAEPARAIAFEDILFGYPGGTRPALDGVSLVIPAGRTTALVGPSGAGKSTVVNLLCRFYDPDRGVISIDGRDLRELELARWRRAIGIVSQDVYMFGATVRENIAYGGDDSDPATVAEAARLADAHEFISALPEGYETRIGDGGVALSGGQRQRIALARAIIRDPRILILDEATNALDSLSEHAIQKALDRFSDGRTVVVIAHRLSTIERADTIIVLHEGRIAEQGNLRELVASGGLFSRMYSLQNAATRA
jgi:ABC-type multidrug transport system fused ATPase/permease subunit